MQKIILSMTLLVVMGALVACKQDSTQKQDEQKNKNLSEPVRAVKVVEVMKDDIIYERRISGVVNSAKVALLSFPVQGFVTKIYVKEGQNVQNNELLAELDPHKYIIDVKSAEANYQKAIAAYQERKINHEANKTLHEKSIISEIDYQKALSDIKIANQVMEVNKAKLNLAEKRLSETKLYAPFAGEISQKIIDEHQFVATGQTVFKLNVSSHHEVEVLVPDKLINYVKNDDEIIIDFSLLNALNVPAYIYSIDSSADIASSFSVIARLKDPLPGLRPGMAAEMILKYSDEKNTEKILIPYTAVLPHNEKNKGYVFIYSKDDNLAVKKEITTNGFIREMMVVNDGLKPGELLIISSPQLLRHGQPIKIYNSIKEIKE